MKTISNAFAELLATSKGKFVTVTFVTKAGNARVMNCRLGVTKALKGGKSTNNTQQYVTVYDMQKKAYRCVNRDTILSISVEGQRAVMY
jgi:hypothetical protein